MDAGFRNILEIQSMAQSALFYVKDAYDKERFERLRDISAELMALKTDLPIETVKNLFCSDFLILVKRIRFITP